MNKKIDYINNKIRLKNCFDITEDIYKNNYQSHLENEVVFYKKYNKNKFRQPFISKDKNYGPFNLLNNEISFNCPKQLILDINKDLDNHKNDSKQKKLRPEVVLCIASMVWHFNYNIMQNIPEKYKNRTTFISHKHLSSIKQDYHRERDWLIEKGYISCDKIKKFNQVDISFNKCYTYFINDKYKYPHNNILFKTPNTCQYTKIYNNISKKWKDFINADGITTILPNDINYITDIIIRDSILEDKYNWNNIYENMALEWQKLARDTDSKILLKKLKNSLITFYKDRALNEDIELINKFISKLKNANTSFEMAEIAASNFQYFDNQLREQQIKSYKEIAYNLIQATYYQDHKMKCDFFSDRIHTRFSRMKGILRNTLQYNGKYLIELDIQSSQLVMFGEIIKNVGNAIQAKSHSYYEGDETCLNFELLKKELNLFSNVLDNDIYIQISKFVFGKVNRAEGKTLTFNTIFDNTERNMKYEQRNETKMKTLQFFQTRFPNMFKIMNIIKRDDYKNFVKNTQKLERNIITDILKKLKKDTIKISIHDAILIEDNEINKQLIKEGILQRVPKAKIKVKTIKTKAFIKQDKNTKVDANKGLCLVTKNREIHEVLLL